MEKATSIIINKNRGWRGLSELVCLDRDNNVIHKMVFSFSNSVWYDLIYYRVIVTSDKDNYYIIYFDNGATGLPGKNQQRSVLITNFKADIRTIATLPKSKPIYSYEHYSEQSFVENYISNKNNHTTSEFNCVGIRVLPNI